MAFPVEVQHAWRAEHRNWHNRQPKLAVPKQAFPRRHTIQDEAGIRVRVDRIAAHLK
jgi:hypothetical protein